MISLAAITGAARTVVKIYKTGVVVYELVRRELRQEPEPMPLTYRDVDHIRSQIARATAHKVKK